MKVFLSAVSGQFKFCRDALASDLRAIGCEVKVQEDFQQGPGSLIAQIESYVAQCDRVIAIVGDAYGADASRDAVPSGNPQRSYTQWEYFFTIGERLRGSSATAKDLYVYFASENYLDQHRVVQSKDEKNRQQSFVDFIKKSGKHRANFDNLDQLCRLVLRDGWQMSGRPNIPRPPFQLPNRALAGQLFGRAALLAQLVDRLLNREHIDIWGPAGMGKTALAAEAIVQVVGDAPDNLAKSPFPDGVVLLDLYRLKFASPDPVWHHLANSFDATVPTTQSAQERAIQACHGRRALVIVEGAEEASDGSGLKELLSVLPQETVRLVLTRNKAQVSTARPFNVEAELERGDAVALLRELWQDGRDETVVDLIYQRFGGHPLALTWAGSQLNAAEESPKAFVQALNAAILPALNEPGYEKHTLPWLYQRSTSHLSADARQVITAAGLLAQQPFPLGAALAILPAADAARARDALKQLVRYGLSRISAGAEERWEFTHALTHQFAHAVADVALLAPLGGWTINAFDQSVIVATQSGDFSPLAQALAHGSALLGADRRAEFLDALARKLRYGGDDTLRALGRLDLVRAANAADRAWLQSADSNKLTGSSWQRELSMSYNNLGDVEVVAGNLDGARTAYEKSLAICGRLAEADLSNIEWQRDLSVNYEKFGDVNVVAGNLNGARAAYEQSLAIRVRLAAEDPNNNVRQWDLSVSYEKLGNVEVATGNLDGACAACEKSLKIRARLAEADSSNSEWQRGLAVSYVNNCEANLAAGNLGGAREALEKGLAIFAHLAAADPSNNSWQWDMSVICEKLGDVDVAAGNLDGAREVCEKNLKIRTRLAEADPSNSVWQRGLAVSYMKSGDVNVAAGNLDRAREALEKGLAIFAHLAAADPGNSEWQRDVSVSYNNLGHVDLAVGNLGRARDACEKSLEIRARLAEADPDNKGWQLDLSMSYYNLGNVDVAAGNLNGARGSYEKCLKIREHLSEVDPGNSQWQQYLSASYMSVGDVLTRVQRSTEALTYFQKNLEITERLAALDPSNVVWRNDLARVKNRIVELQT